MLFNLQQSIDYLDNLTKGKSKKEAFLLLVYSMYCETHNCVARAFTKHDFFNLCDEEALKIMQSLVKMDKDIPIEFWDIKIEDIYERFNKYLQNYISLQTNKITDSLQTLADGAVKQLVSQMTEFGSLQESISDSHRKSMEDITEAFQKLDAAITGYFDVRNVMDPVINEFGWGGLSAVPSGIVYYVNQNRASLTIEDVDGFVLDHFNSHKYKELDRLFKKWEDNKYYYRRKYALSEAIDCYKHKFCVASITLLTVYMEGIICDYLFEHNKTSSTDNKKNVNSMREFEKASAGNSIKYINECHKKMLDAIQDRLTEKFRIDERSNASKLSRHKIAHGQMYEAISEIEVLKTILYLNELYQLLEFLSSQIDS